MENAHQNKTQLLTKTNSKEATMLLKLFAYFSKQYSLEI